MDKSGAGGHCTCDADDFGVGFGELHHGFAENFMIAGKRSFAVAWSLAGLDFKRTRAVEAFWTFDGGFVAFTFFSDDVNDDGLVGFFGKFQVALY